MRKYLLLLPVHGGIDEPCQCRQDLRRDEGLDLGYNEGLDHIAPERHQIFFRYLEFVPNEQTDNQNSDSNQHDGSPLMTSRSWRFRLFFC